MIWYFSDEIAYEFPSNTFVSNALTKRYHKSVYETSDEMEIYYALAWMKRNNVDKMSVAFPIKDLSVQYGDDMDVNMDYCKKEGIHCRYEKRPGGSLVLFPGNIIFLDINPVESPRRFMRFTQDFIRYLKDNGIDAELDGNDIMVDGKKVVGAISTALPEPYDGWVYFGASISINSDAELIDKICTKPMEKVPGALSDYGLTTTDVMQFILDWFYRYEDVYVYNV